MADRFYWRFENGKLHEVSIDDLHTITNREFHTPGGNASSPQAPPFLDDETIKTLPDPSMRKTKRTYKEQNHSQQSRLTSYVSGA